MSPASRESDLHPRVAAWFAKEVGEPTPIQQQAFEASREGQHILVSSPTGTGKSLAALAPVLSSLHEAWDSGHHSDGIVCLYVSPLRALNADVALNLQRPIEQLAEAMRRGGQTPPTIRVGVRSGDTPTEERRRQTLAPPHILVTTPETLAILLGAPRMRVALARVKHIIVDEIHALAGTRRGAHLSLSLERVEQRVRHAGALPPQRIGLSATVGDPKQMAAFLAGNRPVRTIAAGMARARDIRVESCTPNLLGATGDAHEQDLLSRLHHILQQHRTTLVFTNTRKGAERLVAGLRASYPEYSHALASTDSLDTAFTPPDTTDGLAPHHGSMSREGRWIVEAQLKRGDLRCVVASSSLELGIDVGTVDHVVLVGSPRDAARAIQRMGRAGHSIGKVSEATFLALDPDDAIECLAIARQVVDGVLPQTPDTRAWNDVLAQHLVGIALDRPKHIDEVLALVQGAEPYATITKAHLLRVADSLQTERLLTWDEQRRLAPGPAASRARYGQNVGTITSSAKARIRHGDRFVGEVDGIFADSLVAGDVFQLAGEPWRFVRGQGNTLWANPAPGESLTLPVWLSEGLASPLGVMDSTRPFRECPQNALHRPANHAKAMLRSHENESTHPWRQFCSGYLVSAETLTMVERFVNLQVAWVGPWSASECVVETFVDDDARRATVFHLPVGLRINETLGAALRETLSGDDKIRVVAGDTGFATLTPRSAPATRDAFERILQNDIAALVETAAESSDRLLRRERDVADRFFLTRTSGARGPPAAVQARRTRHAVPDSPVREDARWEVLHESWDVDGALAVAAAFASGARTLGPPRKVACASPFAFAILHRGETHPSRQRADAFREAIERVETTLDWNEKKRGVAPHSLGRLIN